MADSSNPLHDEETVATVRPFFAALALSGLLASRRIALDEVVESAEQYAGVAVALGDALIKELQK